MFYGFLRQFLVKDSWRFRFFSLRAFCLNIVLLVFIGGFQLFTGEHGAPSLQGASGALDVADVARLVASPEIGGGQVEVVEFLGRLPYF